MVYLMIIHHTPYTLLIISLIEKYNLHHLSHEFCVTNTQIASREKNKMRNKQTNKQSTIVP